MVMQRRKRSKQTKRSQSSSDENSSDNSSITRCVCGETHSMGLMVQCDKCEVWQHCSCMGLEQPDIPDQYYCEECKPENHKVVRSSNGKTRRQYIDSKAPKKRMTLNSREASMSLEDVLAVKNALEMYEAEEPIEEKSEPPSLTVSSVGHDETPIIAEQEEMKPKKRPRTVKKKRSRTSTPVREASPIAPQSDNEHDENLEITLFDHLSPEARASSPPAKTRQPNARMSISEMNRRANQILEYISSVQVEMATSHHAGHGIEDDDNDSLSSASTIALDHESLEDGNNHQSSLEIMDMLTRKLITFQRKYGPRMDSSRITRTSGAVRNMMAH